MATVCKLQRPIIPSDGPWLIYNESRSHEGMIPDAEIAQDVRDAMGDDLKGYFKGSFQPDGKFAIAQRVKDRHW